MKLLYKFSFFIILLLFFSCSSKKNILYIQDSVENKNYEPSYMVYKIKIDDIINVKVKVDNMEGQIMFNNQSNMEIAESRESLILKGNQVNSEGYIYIPKIGSIKALGLTIDDLRVKIFEKITSLKLLSDPVIDIKIVNNSFTILGEVKNPGKYYFSKNNMNILESIGIAGDLTINGKRNDIKIMRNSNGKTKISTIDLTSTKFIESDFFQIHPGDVIFVNQNTSRIKNAGIIGNSGTLLSLLSFILSLVIITTSSN